MNNDHLTLEPSINEESFRRACRGAGQVNIARHLGISENWLSEMLQNPTKRLKVSTYLRICAFLQEPPENFFVGAHGKK